MKIGSMMAAAMPAPSVTYMARLASPTARRRPDMAMPSASSGMDGSTMRRKPSATSSVRPAAPRPVRNGDRKTRQIAVSALIRAVMNTSPVAAMVRARSLSPAPSARDTRAVMPMVEPMAAEVMKNISVPA